MVDKSVAIEKSLKYFNNDKMAAEVFVAKYALTAPDGDVLEQTPDDLHRRLAKEFARIEKKYPNPYSEEQIYEQLKGFKKIVPQGSPMFGVGNPYQVVSLSNCFIAPPPLDSYGSILRTDEMLAQISKRRGGVGTDISNIRPANAPTKNAARTSTGIGPFMERFSNTIREVGQNSRRGALMLTISIHHPEIKTFINIKKDLEKVTGANLSIRLTDEFLRAVKNDQDFELRFPVNSSEPKFSKMVSAKELWNEIIESAWAVAEPGLLFWDNILKGPADCYEQYRSVSTNPCFSENVLIATADGRNAVSIGQLAKEGKDVPVYSLDPKTGLVSIKMGRNPRITGYNKKLLRITLDDGSHLDVTADHKILLKNGTTVFAKDLQSGESLPRFSKELAKIKTGGKYYYRVNGDIHNPKKDVIFEHRLIAEFNNPEKWKEVYDKEKVSGWIKGGLVVHHKDYDGLNNSPDNLEIMSFKEHQKFHVDHDCAAEKNGRFLGKTSEKILEAAIELTKKLGRKFSREEWKAFAKKEDCPQTFTKMHHSVLGKSSTELGKICAAQLGFEYLDVDPRLVQTLNNMFTQGYAADILNHQVIVQKECETCGISFGVEHNRRETAFCSKECSLIYTNNDKDSVANRLNVNASEAAAKRRAQQAEIYSALKFDFRRPPLLKEWEVACKEKNISYRLGKNMKHGFKFWKEVKEAGDNYNHKVVSVEYVDGDHTVYNITVDDNHMVAVVTDASQNKDGFMSYKGLHVPQCGEIPLSSLDSCRLMIINLLTFVENPFTKSAFFNFEQYNETVMFAQKLMDDMIDLEVEAIEKIIEKINEDEEPYEHKKTELDLWAGVLDACRGGRRTGLGITALGDAIAALSMCYGSKESISFTEEIYKNLGLHAYKTSIRLAEERGAFPDYCFETEKDNELINRIVGLDKNLKSSWKKFGRRNVACTTTAPVGTVSILTQTTSGIEPAFEVVYKRRRKITEKDTNVDFVDDVGDKWQEYEVYHHQYQNWMKITKKVGVENSPYWKARANDVDWAASVELQAAAQKWICHSISKTCNLPKDATRELVSQVYLSAWESGCKGFTVYRDGCRDGVLISSEKKEQATNFIDKHAPKRPKELVCDVFYPTVKGERWTFFVGKLNNRPYEIMGGLSKYISIPKRIKTGKILKQTEGATARYDFHYDYEAQDSETIVKDLSTTFENATQSAFTRTISLALRHGAPTQYIVEQLLKGSEKEDEIFSFSKAVSRVLKSYIIDGIKPSGKACTVCGSANLVYLEGCASCQDCGHSKC